MCRAYYSRGSDDLTQLHVAAPHEDRSRLRASDDDRERTAVLLRDHTAAGRLTPDELDERLGVSYSARTLGELDAVLTDLPGAALPAPSRRVSTPGRRLRPPIAVMGPVLAALVALAVLTDGHTAWLLWPLAFFWMRGRWWGRRGGPPRGGGGQWQRGTTPGVPGPRLP